MTRQTHRALVVEDDADAAADLVDILTTCGCDAVIATNRHDAFLQLASTPFCVVLLDLEIGSEPDSIKGRVEHGKAVLAEARRRFPERGSPGALPIIVMSSHVTGMEPGLAAMRDGASDVIQKLWTTSEKADRIHEALERAGRTSHARCREFLRSAAPPNSPEGLVLSIPGEREGQRAIVTLNERRAPVTMASLKILLRLVEAQLSTGKVHKVDLGGSPERGFKGITELRDELKVAYAGNTKLLIVNDQKSHYRLADGVRIGEVNEERLRDFDDAKVSQAARRICSLIAEKEEFRGNS